MSETTSGITTSRYRILTSIDGGWTWTYLATQEAPNRDNALRRYFTTPPDPEDTLCIAVAESSFRPARVNTKVTVGITDVELPDVKVEQALPEVSSTAETVIMPPPEYGDPREEQQADAVAAGLAPGDPLVAPWPQ